MMGLRDNTLVEGSCVARATHIYYHKLAFGRNIQDLGNVDIVFPGTAFIALFHDPSWVCEAKGPKPPASEICYI